MENVNCCLVEFVYFFFSSRRRHTRCALVTGVQTCALPICRPSQESLMSTAVKRRLVPTSTHWGTYWAEVEGDRLIAVHDYAGDPAPAIIGPGIVDAVTHDTRIGRPMVRKGWLEKREHSDRAGRGREP